MATSRNEQNSGGSSGSRLYDQLKKVSDALKPYGKEVENLVDLHKQMAKAIKDATDALVGKDEGSGSGGSSRRQVEKKTLDFQYATLYTLRGMLDRITRLVGLQSTFLSPHAPAGGVIGTTAFLSVLTLLQTFLGKMDEEYKNLSNVMVQSMQRGFSAEQAINAFSDGARKLVLLNSNERKEVQTDILAANLRELASNTEDQRYDFLYYAKLSKEDVKSQLELMSDLKYVFKSSGEDQVRYLRDLVETGFKTGAGIENLVQLSLQAQDVSKRLYTMFGPEKTQMLNQALTTAVAGAGNQKSREALMSFAQNLITNPEALLKLGISPNAITGASTTNEMTTAILDVFKKVRDSSLTNIAAGSGDLVAGQMMMDSIQKMVGVDIFSIAPVIETAIKNSNQTMVEGFGEEIRSSVGMTAAFGDPERIINTITNRTVAPLVGGLRGAIQDQTRSLTNLVDRIEQRDQAIFDRFKNDTKRR